MLKFPVLAGGFILQMGNVNIRALQNLGRPAVWLCRYACSFVGALLLSATTGSTFEVELFRYCPPHATRSSKPHAAAAGPETDSQNEKDEYDSHKTNHDST